MENYTARTCVQPARWQRALIICTLALIPSLVAGEELRKKSRWRYRNATPKVFYKTKFSEFVFRDNDIIVDLRALKKKIPPTFYSVIDAKTTNLTPKEKGKIDELNLDAIKIIVDPDNPDAVIPQIDHVRALGSDPILQIVLRDSKMIVINGQEQKIAVDPIVECAQIVKRINGFHQRQVTYFNLAYTPLNAAPPTPQTATTTIPAKTNVHRFIKTIVAMRDVQKEISGSAYSIKITGPNIDNSKNDFQSLAAEDCQWLENEKTCLYDNNTAYKNLIDYTLASLARAETGDLTHLNPRGYKLLDYFSIRAHPQFRRQDNNPESFVVAQGGRQDLSGYLMASEMWHTNRINSHDYSFPRRSINFFQWLRQKHQEYYPSAALSISNFSIDRMPNIDYHPLLRPLYYGEFMAISAHNGVASFSKSLLRDTQVPSSKWGLLRPTVTPSFQVLKLLSNYYRGYLLDVHITSIDQKKPLTTTAYATYHDQHVNLLRINKSSSYQCMDLYFRKTQGDREVIGHCQPPYTLTLMRIPVAAKQKRISFHQLGSLELDVRLITP